MVTTQLTERQVRQLLTVMNILLCRFALCGLASHPVTDLDIQSARLIGRHISITGGWATWGERNWGPYALLAAAPEI